VQRIKGGAGRLFSLIRASGAAWLADFSLTLRRVFAFEPHF
jgi:hypothetical protein